MRLGTFLLLASLATAQQSSVTNSARKTNPEPKLPVIDDDACPGKDRVVPHTKMLRDDQVYYSWEDKRVPVGTVKAGEEVIVLSGVNVIREPDRALLKRSDVAPPLKAGDVVLRYGLHPDWNSDFWGKGVWFKVYFEDIEEKGSFCGFGKNQCTIVIIQNGVKEWWVQVKTSTDLTGWVLASNLNGDKHWINRSFAGICGAD